MICYLLFYLFCSSVFVCVVVFVIFLICMIIYYCFAWKDLLSLLEEAESAESGGIAQRMEYLWPRMLAEICFIYNLTQDECETALNSKIFSVMWQLRQVACLDRKETLRFFALSGRSFLLVIRMMKINPAVSCTSIKMFDYVGRFMDTSNTPQSMLASVIGM